MEKWLLLQVLKYADMEYSSDNIVRQTAGRSLINCHSNAIHITRDWHELGLSGKIF